MFFCRPGERFGSNRCAGLRHLHLPVSSRLPDGAKAAHAFFPHVHSSLTFGAKPSIMFFYNCGVSLWCVAFGTTLPAFKELNR
ncbi:MAG: hypothetical protein JSW58_01510, partial [Candidatus Latescibacterota bacterium]